MTHLFTKIRKAIFGYDVFISYSRKDGLDYAYAIALHLADKGYECYIDQLSSVMPGNELPPNIRDAVKRSTAFVLVGSEGSVHSLPVAQEVRLFLESNRNRPLIPVTIGGAAFSADWYDQVKGLAIIDDVPANLAAGAPAPDVLSRVENALGFTKKSVRLRRVAAVTALSVLALIIGASVVIRQEVKQVAIARKEQQQAIKKTNEALKAREAAVKQQLLAEQSAKLANEQVKDAKVKLAAIRIRVKLLGKKNEVQNLIYTAKLENNLGNSTAAYKYVRKALVKEKSIPGASSAAWTAAGFINSFMPKYLDIDAMPYHYAVYNSDHWANNCSMLINQGMSSYTQFLAFIQEPQIDNATRMLSDHDGYCPTWINKSLELGIFDAKKNQLCKMGRNQKGQYYRNLSFRSFYFAASGNNFKGLFSEDHSDTIGKKIHYYEFDAALRIHKDYLLDTAISTFLRQIAAKDRNGDYYYICPNNYAKDDLTLSLLHLSDTSSLTLVHLNDTVSGREEILLPHMKFHQDRYARPSYLFLKYLRVTDSAVFFVANDSLFCHERQSGRETLLMTLRKPACANWTYNYDIHYEFSGADPMVMVSDSGNRLTLFKQAGSGWQPFMQRGFEFDVDSMGFNTFANHFLIYTKTQKYSIGMAEFFKNPTGFSTGEYFDQDRSNFHIVSDGELKLTDNNHPEINTTLPSARPALYQYLPQSKSIFAVNTGTEVGKVSLTDISNVVLDPGNITDDKEFDLQQFIEMPDWLMTDTVTVQSGKRAMRATLGKIWIKDQKGSKIYEPDDALGAAGFMKSPGCIYFITMTGELNSDLTFNIYDYRNNYRYAFQLKKLLYNADAYLITNKFIYFYERATQQEKVTRKMVRIVNPAISRPEMEKMLAKSIY